VRQAGALLLEAAARLVPALHERLARIGAFAGTEDEPWAVQQAYALAPSASFSRAVLEACPSLLAMRALPPLPWSDLGTPERVMRTLKRLGLSPPWLAAEARSA
jgi:mannose-1-phosphate guanylyltransferase